MQYKNEIWEREDGFTIFTEKKYLDVDLIHRFLSQDSYWVKGISKELVAKMIQNSTICFGVYEGNPIHDHANSKQIGFARVLSDEVRYSWLGDVFIVPEYRGKGLSKWLMHTIVELPYLKGTSFNLATQDAQGLYEQFGFKVIENPQTRMLRPLNWDIINEVHNVKE